jgi:hypothetical protein
MKNEVDKILKEVDKLRDKISNLELTALYTQLKDSSIKSFECSYESEYNDEGGSYLVFRLDKLNGKHLEESLHEYFFEDNDSSELDWFCSFCLENNLKEAEIEAFMTVFFQHLSNDTKENLCQSTVTVAQLKKKIDKINKA